MPKTIFPINLQKPMSEQELVGHNRWHPDIPSAVAVNPGDSFRIECTANALHGGEVWLREHVAHGVLLLFSHAVLASDRPAIIDAEMQNAIGEIEGFFFLAGNRAIVKHERVQVAVSSMKNVRDAEAIGVGHRLDLLE